MSGGGPQYVHKDHPGNAYERLSIDLAGRVTLWMNRMVAAYPSEAWPAVSLALFNALMAGVQALFLAAPPDLRDEYVNGLRGQADDLESGKAEAICGSKGQA